VIYTNFSKIKHIYHILIEIVWKLLQSLLVFALLGVHPIYAILGASLIRPLSTEMHNKANILQ